VIHDVPPAPAFVALARFMYDPGAFFPTAAGAGPVVVRLEAGALSFHTEKPVYLTRGGPPADPQEIPGGGSFDVGIGDQIYVPGDTPHSATNRARLSAVSGGLAIFRGAPAQEFPPGLTFHPLVIGQALSLPPGSALETVDRLTYGPGGRDPSRTEGGLGLYYVEQGKLGLGVEQGQVVVNRRVKVISGQPPGPPPPPEPVQPGSQTTLDIGEGAVVQTGSVVTTWNAGDGSTVALRALVEPAAAGGGGGGGGGGQDARDVVLSYFYDVWDSGNTGLVDQLFAPDFTNNNLLAGQQPGVVGVRQLVSRFRRAFPDCAVSVDLQLAEGDRVVTRYTVRGTHRDAFQGVPATGRSVQVSGIAIHRVAGGRIAEAWGYWDQASLLVQLGAFQFPNVGGA
jgi:steroid delta-isomerase-like uncharacterized protein